MKNIKKKDINLLESQKTTTKGNTKSSFQTVMIACVVLLVGVMGYLYYTIYTQYTDKVKENQRIQREIDGYASMATLRDNIAEANRQIESVTASIAELNRVNEAASSEIELTQTHVIVLYYEAAYLNVEVSNLSYTGTTLTFTVTGPTKQDIYNFITTLNSTERGAAGYVCSDLFGKYSSAQSEVIGENSYSQAFNVSLKALTGVQATAAGAAAAVLANAEGGNN